MKLNPRIARIQLVNAGSYAAGGSNLNVDISDILKKYAILQVLSAHWETNRTAGASTMDCKFQAQHDGTNWVDLNNFTQDADGTGRETIALTKGVATKCRLVMAPGAGTTCTVSVWLNVILAGSGYGTEVS